MSRANHRGPPRLARTHTERVGRQEGGHSWLAQRPWRNLGDPILGSAPDRAGAVAGEVFPAKVNAASSLTSADFERFSDSFIVLSKYKSLELLDSEGRVGYFSK